MTSAELRALMDATYAELAALIKKHKAQWFDVRWSK